MQSNNKIEKPPEGNDAQKNSGDDLSRPRPQWLTRGLFDAIAPIALLVIVVGGVAAHYAYHYVTKDSVRFPFWVSFMFSLLAFIVLLVQSVIYAQQAEFMKQQSKAMGESVERTDTIIDKMQLQLDEMKTENAALYETLEWERAKNEPRLRITNVRVEGLEAGMGPVFVVSIINDGAMDAEDVELFIRVTYAKDDRDAVQWGRPQIFTIPAHQEHHYPLSWRTSLSEESVAGFSDNVPLKVRGYFVWNNETTEICYRYYPLRNRPAGVPQFIPCHISFAGRYFIAPKGIEYQTAFGNVTATHGRNPEGPKKPDAEQDGEDNGENPN